MSSDSKIYVDAGQPATLNDGAGRLTDCATLQEAVLAWHALPSAQKIRATVKVIGGPVYTAHQIDRLAEAAGLRHARQSRALPRNRRPDEADRRNRTCGAAPLGFDDRRFDTHSNCARAPVTAAMKSPSG
jgi:hypothetical protein